MTNIKTKIKTGEWDGEQIWREKTGEEKLEEAGIKPSEVMTYLALLSKK